MESFMEKARSLVMYHEGLELFPYKDAVGKTTIGYGRNLSDRGVSPDEAEYLLENDLRIALIDAQALLGAHWDGLSDNRKAVLVDMALNLGKPRLAAFVEFLEALKAGDYERAADEMMDSLWARQVRRRAVALTKIIREG